MFTTIADSVKTLHPTNGSLEMKEDTDAGSHVVYANDYRHIPTSSKIKKELVFEDFISSFMLIHFNPLFANIWNRH